MDVYPPVSLSLPWQMYYFAEFLALQHHKWLWNWLLSLVHLHHQCRQQERCARLEEHVCVRKLLQSLRESTDTGYWYDACKHLKGTSEKQGISVFRSLGFGALNFPVSHKEIPDFRAAFASETVPSLCSTFLYRILLRHIRKPQTSCNSLAYQNATESLQFTCFLSPLYKCCVTCKNESSLAAFSFLIPRLASSQRIRDHWGAPETTASLRNHCPPHVQRWVMQVKSLTTAPLSLMDLASGHTA